VGLGYLVEQQGALVRARLREVAVVAPASAEEEGEDPPV